MQINLRAVFVALLTTTNFCFQLRSQATAPSSGEITVRMVRSLDSAVDRPRQPAPATVVKSSDPSIFPGSAAVVQLLADASGFTVQLVRLSANGQILRTASSSVVLAEGKILGTASRYLRQPGQPQDSVSGTRVFLPQGTNVRFTLTTPPPPPPVRNLPRTPAALPVTTSPLPPAHPASTVVDLPPGAPGYPSLHAARPANDNCWWAPFVSDKFKFEMAVQKCADPTQETHFSETDKGVAEQYQKPPLSEPTLIFSVHSKPAEQSIEAAIKQQFISKLKTPGARTNCRATKASEGVGGWDSYNVSAAGSTYSKFKRFQSREPGGDTPCQQFDGGEVANYFLYQPAESKTKFIYIEGQSDLVTILPWDETSIRFLP